MKKIKLLVTSLILILGLTSCGGDSDAIDTSATLKQISVDWLNNVNYETSAFNEFKEGANHYELYLPVESDISSSLRINIAKLPDGFTGKNQELLVNYASTSNFSDADYKSFISSLNSSTVKSSISDQTGYEPNGSLSTKVSFDDNFLADASTSKYVATIYMPIMVKYIKYKKDDSSYFTLKTYILVPLKTIHTTSTDNENYDDELVNNYKDKKITFDIKNGAIK